jgi:hypothetical protein
MHYEYRTQKEIYYHRQIEISYNEKLRKYIHYNYIYTSFPTCKKTQTFIFMELLAQTFIFTLNLAIP